MVLIDYEKKEESKEDTKGPHKPGQAGNMGAAARGRQAGAKKEEKKVEETHEE